MKNDHLHRTIRCLHTEYLDAHPFIAMFSSDYIYSRPYAEWLEERYASLCLAMVEGIAQSLVEGE